MSLLFVDGFDHYATADIAKKWTANNGSVISGAAARSGSQGLNNNDIGHYVTKTLAVADQHATFIVGFAFQRQNANDDQIVGFWSDAATTQHIGICFNTTGAIRVTRGNRTGTTLGTSNPVINVGAWHYMEVKVVLSDSVGSVTIRLDGKQILSLTGTDTKNGGTATVFDTIALGLVGSNSFSFPTVYVDDVYIANGAGSVNNDFIGECRVRTVFPDGNGNSSQLLGSDADSTNNYQLVDEATPNTADYVGSSVDNQKDTYTFQNLVDTSGTVAGVQLGAYATKTDTGARSFAFVTRHSGTDYDSGDITLAFGSNGYFLSTQELNPGTATAWTRADINAAEFGFKVRP